MPDPFCVQDRQGVWHITQDGTEPTRRDVEPRALCGEKLAAKKGKPFERRLPNCHACQAAWDAKKS